MNRVAVGRRAVHIEVDAPRLGRRRLEERAKFLVDAAFHPRLRPNERITVTSPATHTTSRFALHRSDVSPSGT
jgi:hypothetical protein